MIRIADESEMGWKVVDEYIQSEVASDEEDQKRIHRAQSRAARNGEIRQGSTVEAVQSVWSLFWG